MWQIGRLWYLKMQPIAILDTDLRLTFANHYVTEKRIFKHFAFGCDILFFGKTLTVRVCRES